MSKTTNLSALADNARIVGNSVFLEGNSGVFFDDGSSYARGIYSSGTDVRIQTNAMNRLQVDSEGRVTMPYQPSFCVGDGQSVQGASYVMYQNVRHNVGGHYNVSNGRFTAPVTGVYHFNCYIQAHTTAYNTYTSILWQVNGSTVVTSELVDTWNGGGDHSTIGGGIDLHMNAGDYMQVYASRGYRGIQGYMSGHLVG